MIERFIDVMSFEQRLPQDVRESWLSHLTVIDAWSQVSLGRTLIGVDSCGLRQFIRQCVAVGLNTREMAEITTVARHFYRYLRNARYREDDPSRRLPRDLESRACAAPGARESVGG